MRKVERGHCHGRSILKRVWVAGFDSAIIVEKGKTVRDWAAMKLALASESERLRDLAKLHATPPSKPPTEDVPRKDSSDMLIDTIFGFDSPRDGGFDQFGISFSGNSMFEDPSGNAGHDDSDRLPPF
jgi:hypothetical protein